MTKSAVRAMDTVTSVVSSTSRERTDRGQVCCRRRFKARLDYLDNRYRRSRVIAIAPIVIDMLNVSDSFKHHYSVYGAYSLAVIDYVTSGVVNWIDTPEWDELMDMVEPYEYRDRLTLPKYILNSTGDEFFLPDSWQFYWDELVGEKHLRYVPNSNHSMSDTDVIDSLTLGTTQSSTTCHCRAIRGAFPTQEPLPCFHWTSRQKSCSGRLLTNPRETLLRQKSVGPTAALKSVQRPQESMKSRWNSPFQDTWPTTWKPSMKAASPVFRSSSALELR